MVRAQVLANYPRTPWALVGLRDVRTTAEAQGEALPDSVPTLAAVNDLLSAVQEEAGCGAVQVPTSCPAFSQPA